MWVVFLHRKHVLGCRNHVCGGSYTIDTMTHDNSLAARFIDNLL